MRRRPGTGAPSGLDSHNVEDMFNPFYNSSSSIIRIGEMDLEAYRGRNVKHACPIEGVTMGLNVPYVCDGQRMLAGDSSCL